VRPWALSIPLDMRINRARFRHRRKLVLLVAVLVVAGVKYAAHFS
jgi:hypothetical protein